MRINQNIKGVVFRNVVKENSGFTLFTVASDKSIYLIDMKGRLVHKWEVDLAPVYKVELLRNGNLLYTGKTKNGRMSDFEGASGKIIETDWDNNIVWEYEDNYMHNSFYRKKSGNILFIKWIEVPNNLINKVKGGVLENKDNSIMWTDQICEINNSKRIIWEWKTYEHLDIDNNVICPVFCRREWTHASSLYVANDGSILINFMLTNTIVKINPETKNIEWSWGPGETSEAHFIDKTFEDKILIFDNGLHSIGTTGEFSRVLEVSPLKGKISWEYVENPLFYFYSSIYGCCQRLENGNTLICDADDGCIFEVNNKKELVWEYINPYYSHGEKYGTNNIVTFARRYPPDFPGFENKNFLI
jgi:hypothetical protein